MLYLNGTISEIWPGLGRAGQIYVTVIIRTNAKVYSVQLYTLISHLGRILIAVYSLAQVNLYMRKIAAHVFVHIKEYKCFT